MSDAKEEHAFKNLEDDDEFEDFPEDTKWSSGSSESTQGASLWEEDWDDDDVHDQFSNQLRDELKRARK